MYITENGIRVPYAVFLIGFYHFRFWFSGDLKNKDHVMTAFDEIDLAKSPVYMSTIAKNALAGKHGGTSDFFNKSVFFHLKDQSVNLMIFQADDYGKPSYAIKSFNKMKEDFMRELPQLKTPDTLKKYAIMHRDVEFASDDLDAVNFFDDLEAIAYKTTVQSPVK